MANSYHLTTTDDAFTITRTDGVAVTVGRSKDGAAMTPLELFVASVVACTASTVATMVGEQHDGLRVAPDMTYRYSQAIGATHEVQRIMVTVAGVEGHAEIDMPALAHDAEETRCTVSLTIKNPPKVEFRS